MSFQTLDDLNLVLLFVQWSGVMKKKFFFFSFRKCAFACWLHHFLTTWPWENHSGFYICSVQFSHSVMSDSLWPQGLQHTRLPCPSPTPRACSNSCPLRQWCHPTILSSVVPFSPAFNLSQHQGLFKWVSSLHQVDKILEFQLPHQSFQWTPRTYLL